MRKLILLFPLVPLLSCGKSSNEPGKPVGEKPAIVVVSPLVNVDYADSVSVEVRFSDDRGLKAAYITLSTSSGTTYYSGQKSLSGTADTLEFKAPVAVGFDYTGSNLIDVQCADTDENVHSVQEVFVVKDRVKPQVIFTLFSTSVNSGPNGLIEANFTLTDKLGLSEYTATLWELNAQEEPETEWKKFSKTGLNGVKSFNASHNFLSTSSGYPAGSKYQLIVTVSDISGNTAEYRSETGTVN